ncbi:MAG: hypothetical protein Q9165_005013 [Trypethelium subeluteriae]
MAAKEVVLLSSSPIQLLEVAETPPATQRQVIYAASRLSPDLVSPTGLLKVKTNALRTGSRAAQIPYGATTGFTSAATLLRDTQSSVDVHRYGAKDPTSLGASQNSGLDTSRTERTLVEGGKRTKKQQLTDEDSRRSFKKAKACGSNDYPEIDLQDPFPDVSVLEIPESPHVAQAARSLPTPPSAPAPPSTIRRTSASSNDPKQQTKIKKGLVTKPKVASGTSKQPKGSGKQNARHRSTGATSEHFEHHDGKIPSTMIQNSSKEIANRLSITGDPAKDAPLLLEQATVRRTDWTPPRACQEPGLEPEIISPTGDRSGDGSKDGKNEGHSKKFFPDFCGHFNYSQKPIRPPSVSPEKSPRIAPGEPYPKKRRIELITISTSALDPSIVESTKKSSKSPKKKPTTITARATAQYRAAEPIPSESNSFSKFFEPECVTSRIAETRIEPKASALIQNGAKAACRRKSPSKARRDETDKGNRRKANKTQKSIRGRSRLYSPEAAMKRAERQDLVFGSSSQLASGESPSFIRDMQQAIRESEAVTPLQEPAYNMARMDQIHVKRPSSLVGAARGLWSAAARDHDNGTLCPESKQSEALPSAPSDEKEPSFVHIDDLETETLAASQTRNGTQILSNASTEGTHADSASLAAETDTGLTFVDGVSAKETGKSSVHRKQNTVDTSPDIARPGAEEECQQALLVRQANEGTTDPLHLKSTKRARGRPRKDPSHPSQPRKSRKAPGSHMGQPTSIEQRRSITPKKDISQLIENEKWQDIDEISDYEAPPTPSPPRRRASQSPHPPQALDLASTASNQAAKKLSKQSRKLGKNSLPFSSTSKASHLGPATAEERALWPSIAERLFPFLTVVVKAAPRSSDPKRPNWHEKILMYDPIVAEDLTEWLWGRMEAETEFEGRDWEWWDKGKGLRAWMVRRWCEEMGVCCVMKEGGRRWDGKSEEV